jgi:hypothetical protein
LNELCLATLAIEWRHRQPGDRGRDCLSMIASNEMQAQIQSG